MGTKSLSYLSDEFTQLQNTTGVDDPIARIDPDDGTVLSLLNHISTGAARGLAVIAKLRDANGDPLPTDTELILTVERPTDDQPVAVSVKEDNIAPWNSLSTSEQRNEENIDAVKIQLKAQRINVTYRDTMFIEAKSSAQIDWSNSELYFVREGVLETASED